MTFNADQLGRRKEKDAGRKNVISIKDKRYVAMR